MKIWLAALLFATSLLAQDKPASEAPKELPTARAVIDRYITEIGGKEAFLKKNSVLMKGRTEVAGKELGGAMSLATAKPNKLLLSVELAGISMRSGYDGKIGWQLNPLTGPSIMEEKELEGMKRQADFFAILHDDKNFKSMTNLGKAQFEGEDCYKLKLVYTDGTDSTEFYSVQSGLQVGFAGAQESSLGTINATSINHEHKQFGDVKLPSRVTQKMAGLAQTMIIESVEFDTLPESAFALPPEIKALVSGPLRPQEPTPKPAEKPAP